MCKQIPLTKGKECLIDDRDFESVSSYKWFLVQGSKSNFYAGRNIYEKGKKITLLMHRYLMNPARGMSVDHIDGNGLNNQRINLRICTHQENIWNAKKNKNGTSSKFKGVHFHKKTGKFRSQMRFGSKRIEIGLFDSPEKAAKAYDLKAMEIRGGFAKLNQSEVCHL